MCGSIRCICTANMKSLSIIAEKLWPRLKLSVTNTQTNRQTGRKQYAPPLAGGIIKMGNYINKCGHEWVNVHWGPKVFEHYQKSPLQTMLDLLYTHMIYKDIFQPFHFKFLPLYTDYLVILTFDKILTNAYRCFRSGCGV